MASFFHDSNLDWKMALRETLIADLFISTNSRNPKIYFNQIFLKFREHGN